MIYIAICDDEPIVLEKNTQMISKVLDGLGALYEMRQYHSGQELIDRPEIHNLVFLDIDMPEMNGMETAKRLRQSNPEAILVFLTSHEEHMADSFAVETFRYLIKPLSLEKLSETLQHALAKIHKQRGEILPIYLSPTQKIHLPIHHIYYIETKRRGVIFHTKDGEYSSSMKINELEELLNGYDFFRTHKSFLVNMNHIREHDQHDIFLLQGNRVPVSRDRLSRFKKEFVPFLCKGSIV